MVYTFGAFELDSRTGELKKSSLGLKLGGQPRQVLTLLVERQGEVVTRQEIKAALWREGTFTDFDHGVDTAIERIRRVLGDSARSPRFVETLHGQGYRFVAPVETKAKGEPEALRSQESSRLPRIAVLPFKPPSGDSDMATFAKELTDEITAGLSQFRHLTVVSARAAADLGARFLIEGSVRRTGKSIRVSVQLIDSATGEHLWAERLNCDADAADELQAQDELTDRIVATVADPFGVLTRSLGALAKAKPVETLTADECVLRWFSYWGQVREEEHAELRHTFERVLEREPNHADARACLCFLYIDEIRHHYNVLPEPALRALRTAQRAVEIDKTSPLAYRALAEAHFFRREIGAFRKAAERVMALNPRDTSNVGFMGTLMSYAGDWDAGCSAVRRAMKLNPHHGGWMHIVLSFDHLRRRDHELALAEAEQVNMPGYPWASGIQAIIHAHLGRLDTAREHLARFLELAPDMAQNAGAEMSAWFPVEQPDLAGHFADGLRKAGLEFE